MAKNEIIKWLLKGDISIQYQVHRDLLCSEKRGIRNRISREGWGARFLSFQKANGHWGQAYYQPKWTSTHYTLVDMKNLGIAPDEKEIQETIAMLLKGEKGPDGGINSSPNIKESDVCMNGMFLNFASYFRASQNELKSIIDFNVLQRMKDGGFNCNFNRKGARHSSLHSTLSVIEGIREYLQNGFTYRSREMQKAEQSSQEFILQHNLFQSHHTGEIIDKKFLMLSYPCRWHYDILRALDYFSSFRHKI